MGHLLYFGAGPEVTTTFEVPLGFRYEAASGIIFVSSPRESSIHSARSQQCCVADTCIASAHWRPRSLEKWPCLMVLLSYYPEAWLQEHS